MVAFLWNLGFSEIAVVLIVSVLIFGKRLPQVAGQAIGHVARLRRHLDTLRRESGIDREIFDVRRTFRDLGRDLEEDATSRKPYPRDPAWRERRELSEEAVEVRQAEAASPAEAPREEPELKPEREPEPEQEKDPDRPS